MAIDNKDKKVLKSSIEREQNEVACSAECEKIKGSKNLNVPPLRFPEFTEEWKAEQLDNIATLSKGIGISKEQLSEDGEPCILYGELYTKYKSEIIKQVESKTDINGSKLKRSKANDVIIPCSGETAVDIATARCVPFDNILFGGDLNVISLHQYDGAFMSYQLNGKRKYDIARVAQGVSIVHLYGEHLKAIKTYNPTLPEQQKIAKLLSLLDDRIDTQNKIIEKLQSLIKGIAQHCIKESTSGNTYVKLGDICQITTGKLDANAQVDNGIYPFFTCAEQPFKIDSFAFDTEALLISGNGANLGYINYYKGKFNAYQRTYVLDLFSENIQYIKWALKVLLPKRIAIEKSSSNTPYIVLSTLTDLRLPIPCKSKQSFIANLMQSLERKLSNQIAQYDSYNYLKQYLLRQMFI
ncbi:restriction endonuclease subunit S [Bacteroides thetaiotaomicron]|uniref:restriction endonuclease subunit S n=1 Tax=Bacteroides TaxID=816 RepID=UPI0039C2E84A